jgi:hypothetical protein
MKLDKSYTIIMIHPIRSGWQLGFCKTKVSKKHGIPAPGHGILQFSQNDSFGEKKEVQTSFYYSVKITQA